MNKFSVKFLFLSNCLVRASVVVQSRLLMKWSPSYSYINSFKCCMCTDWIMNSLVYTFTDLLLSSHLAIRTITSASHYLLTLMLPTSAPSCTLQFPLTAYVSHIYLFCMLFHLYAPTYHLVCSHIVFPFPLMLFG